ncbi:hypothetical protein CDAR_425071 [Caerostris darwini]|uniref:Uncharacterized protein n=1 Tax=Caerostris darwini TaxID=1538125 RepID=A0AAV4X915_9ARAC|nr:hypothetical protein CDAR_425071 [Caerostris darwini]
MFNNATANAPLQNNQPPKASVQAQAAAVDATVNMRPNGARMISRITRHPVLNISFQPYSDASLENANIPRCVFPVSFPEVISACNRKACL